METRKLSLNTSLIDAKEFERIKGNIESDNWRKEAESLNGSGIRETELGKGSESQIAVLGDKPKAQLSQVISKRTLPYCPTRLFELDKVKAIHNQWNCALSCEATVQWRMIS
ncbi:hypothetical protein BY996DRAFT_6424200 [Phakopsora pachyrhizi]|nr:hypothetical protein BY996DRAFT_6424200 [Phakopsora pachyrhizi]